MPRRTHTNILATIGPASSPPEILEKLVDAGADAFRFNFSHGTHADHKRNYEAVRKLEKKKGAYLTVVADLQGPKLRVGEFDGGRVFLKEGARFVLDMNPKPGDATRACLPHKEIFQAVKVGDELLLDDGNIVLKVESKGRDSMATKVKFGGYLSSHKGVNLPNIRLPISAITEKDRDDLKFALKMGADWVCLSFVQKADDVREARKLINGKAWIISKLEKPSAIEELDEIVRLSDGVMVARGDLGVECPVQTVPVLQKKIVAACRKHGKPVIVATQMLESMIHNPSPTRAEVSDVANAVYDGADAVMLSAETAAGKFPVEAVSMMKKIIQNVEADGLYAKVLGAMHEEPECACEPDAISFAAGEVAGALKNVGCIVTYTVSGSTALITARERPILPIVAITQDLKIARRLGLLWGTTAFLNAGTFRNFAKVEETTVKICVANKFAKSGEHIVITAGYPLNRKGKTNMLHTVYVP